MKNTTQTNYATGQDLLRKAVSTEKEANRYYGQYVQWVAQGNVPLEVIKEQLIEAKGWSINTAKKAAANVIALGEAENSKHLEDLLNGDINFDIARVRVTVASGRASSSPYQDDETAIAYLNKAVLIMMQRHKQWPQKEILNWIHNICASAIKRNSPDAAAK